jgi:hypothetical protein
MFTIDFIFSHWLIINIDSEILSLSSYTLRMSVTMSVLWRYMLPELSGLKCVW